MTTIIPVKYADQHHKPFEPGDTLPPGTIDLTGRIVSGDDCIIVTNMPDGSVQLALADCNTAPQDSVHNITALEVTPVSAPEGTTFTFTATVDVPVVGNALVLALALSGTEQAAHNYQTPRTITIPSGQVSGAVTVTTTNDAAGGPSTQLTGAIQNNPRLTGVGTPATATVTPVAAADSTHTGSLTVTPTTAAEGTTFTYTLTLDAPVAGSPLTVLAVLSGSEQSAHAYATPRSITVPVGQTTGAFTVTTTNDAAGGADTQLTATITPTVRFTNTPAATATVTANAVPDSTHTISNLAVAPTTAPEGTTFTFTATVNSPVAGSALAIDLALSGTEQADHNYTTPRTILIPVGQTSGTAAVVTVNDSAGGPSKQLTGAIQSSPRLSGTGAPATATVTAVAVPDSTHMINSITPVTTPINEGQQACWVVTLSTPVAGSDLTIGFTLTGSEQATNNYPAPSLTIPVGQTTGTVCVNTLNQTRLGSTSLCITGVTSSRITFAPSASCISVLGTAVPASTHTVTSLTPVTTPITEGQQACWNVTLNSAVSGGDLTIPIVLSGTEQAAHSYPAPAVTIANGQSTGSFCVTTVDDVAAADTQLCATIAASGRVMSGAGPSCVAVEGSVQLTPPAFGVGYTAQSRGTHNTESTLRLVIAPDGTWQIQLYAAPGGVGGAATTTGAPLSGTWLSNGNALDYEVRVTTSNVADEIMGGGGAVTPDGVGVWAPPSSMHMLEATTGNYTNGDSEANGSYSGEVLVEFRAVGGGPVLAANGFIFDLVVGTPV